MKKALSVIGNIVTTVILIFAVIMTIFTVISVNTIGKDANIFGFKPYIVLSDSMKDTFEVGDIAVSRKILAEELEAGDIVTFTSIDPANYGEVVTHKIREITTYEGQLAFITYGTATGNDDAYPALFSNVIGEYQFKIPKAGYFFEFLKTPMGYFSMIFTPFLILIILEAARFFRLMKQYKEEQRAELNVKNAEIDARKAENQRMKLEIERLRMQLKAEQEHKKSENGGKD